MSAEQTKYYQWAWALALLFAVLRLAFIGSIQLAPDEAYYWEWSRHLDLSYYDQGPMLALVIRAGTGLFGHNEWGVRLGAVGAALGISIFYLWLSRRLRQPAMALWLVLAANGMLLFSVGGVLMMHDTLAAFFWCLGLAAALKAVDGDGRWWLAAGLAGGAGVLSKYTAVLLLPCLALACVSHPGLRIHLRRVWFWTGAMLGGLLAGTPILSWNKLHDWPSLKHVASLGGSDGSRVSLTSFPEFVGSQFALVTPLLFLLLLAAWGWGWKLRGEDDGPGRTRWLLWCCSVPVLALFLGLSLRSRVEGNWPAPAYLSALPLAGLHLVALGQLRSRRSVLALGVALIFSGVVFTQAAWGWLPLPAAEAPRVDGTYRLQGWRDLAVRVGMEQAKLRGDAFVGCRTYQNAAELAFYGAGQERPLILQKDPLNHQYRFWNRPGDFIGRDAILVVGQDWELNEMREMFKSVETLPPFVSERRGVAMRKTLLYVGRHFVGEAR